MSHRALAFAAATVALACLSLSVPDPARAAAAGLDVGAASALTLAGRVVDAGTGEPIRGAAVSVWGERVSKDVETGVDGAYELVLQDSEGLGILDVSVAHADYRQRSLVAALATLAPKRLDVTVSPTALRVDGAGKREEMACTDAARAASGVGAHGSIAPSCAGAFRGFALADGPDRIAVAGDAAFTARLGGGRAEVRSSKAVSLKAMWDVSLVPR